MLGSLGRLWSEQPCQIEVRTPVEGAGRQHCENAEAYLWRLGGTLKRLIVIPGAVEAKPTQGCCHTYMCRQISVAGCVDVTR